MTVFSSDDACEWDSEKNLINIKKHHLSFETASRVFLDPKEKKAYDDFIKSYTGTN